MIVTLSDECLDDVASKVAELEEAGFETVEVLELLGQVTGVWKGKDPSRLLSISGVQSVEESREVRIPPPESVVQ